MKPEIIAHYESLVFEPHIVKDEGGVEHQQFSIKEDQALGILLLEGVVIQTEDAEHFSSTYFLWNSEKLSWLGQDFLEIPPTEIDLLFDSWWSNTKWGALIWAMEYYEFKPPLIIEDQMREDGVWQQYMDDFEDYRFSMKEVSDAEDEKLFFEKLITKIKSWFQ